MSEDIDLEREKNESYELGQISQLERVTKDLRERAGELWINSSPTDSKTAKKYKKLAKEYERRAEKGRERWEEKYKE